MKKIITFSVDVEIEVPDDRVNDIIGRTQTEEWRRNFYTLSEDEAWGMIARNGVLGRRISSLEGWGDVEEDPTGWPWAVPINDFSWEIVDIVTG